MKKAITYILLAILISISFVACNDGTEGLISKAMTAKKEESHNLLYILGRSEDNKLLYVCTNEGIYSYSGNGIFSYVEGNGTSALNTLYYDGVTKVVYKDKSTYKVNIATSKEDEIVKLKNKTFKNMYSPDGVSFTYLFSNENDELLGFFSNTKNDLFSNEIALPKSSSLIGNGAFSKEENDKYHVTSIKDGSMNWKECGNKQISGFVENDKARVATNTNNDYFYNGELKDISSKSSSQPFVAISNDAKYIFFPHSSTYITTSDKSETKPSNGGLDSISILSATKSTKDDNKYLLISTSNGAFILDTASKTLNKINGIDFGEYVF